MTKKLFIPANPDATNSELDAKKIVKNVQLTSTQRDEIAQQFAELVVDGMDYKSMEQYIYDNMMEYFSKLTTNELEEEVYNHDEELWEELVDNVTNETVLDINNNGGKF